MRSVPTISQNKGGQPARRPREPKTVFRRKAADAKYSGCVISDVNTNGSIESRERKLYAFCYLYYPI